jgi:hypothetical protein
VVPRPKNGRPGEKQQRNQEKSAPKNKGFINAGTGGNQLTEFILRVYAVYAGQ